MENASSLVQESEFVRELSSRGLWIPSSVPGVYGRSGRFEQVVAALDGALETFAVEDQAEPIFFPPVMPREVVRRTGYMENFPQLCGSIHSFGGNDAAHLRLLADVEAGKPWDSHLTQTDLVLCPAACYPLYPTLSGALGAEQRIYTLWSYVFRREPSLDPGRLQMFRMRENVCIGSAERVTRWRDGWLERGERLLSELGLKVRADLANDPFFGRGGKVMSQSQRAQSLKFELLAPVGDLTPETAVASFNYHQDHYSGTFGIKLPSGETAHTACMGFGLERTALALFTAHGFVPEAWPKAVRERLRL